MSEEKEPVDEIDLDPKPIVENNDKELDTLVSEMPAVVDEAVQAAESKEKEAVQAYKNIQDNKGRAFDPSMHEVDKDGNPLVTPTGRFKRKSIKHPGGAKLNLPENQPQADPLALKIKQQAVMWADAFIHLGMSLFGEDWKPEASAGFNERDLLIAANERFMTERGIVELPAWAEMALAHVMYCAKRFNAPKVKTAREKIWSWGKNKATNFWLWITGKEFKVVPRKEASDK